MIDGIDGQNTIIKKGNNNVSKGIIQDFLFDL